MKIYLVGGAVRDKLLGLPVKERDYVVVGSTIEEMLAQKFRQVGKEFPVFLHPKTGEEYALARAERKVKPGYKGFVFDTSKEVTLEEDLKRRDLTINAMAYDEVQAKIIDPFGGRNDIADRLLRHVSEAFQEDPVRILRVGRFVARFAHLGFSVYPDTMHLMKKMVSAGEVDALVAERVWKELERALREKNPELFFEILYQCQALPILFPHLAIKGAGMRALKASIAISYDPLIRFAALLHDYDGADAKEAKKNIQALCHRYRAPNLYRELAILTVLHYKQAFAAPTLDASSLLSLLTALDVFRRENRFQNFLTVCNVIAKADGMVFDQHFLWSCAKAATTLNLKDLLAEGLSGNTLVTAIRTKRIQAIEQFLTHPSA